MGDEALRHCLKKCSRGGPETSRQSPWPWCPGSRQLRNRRQELFMTLSSTGKSYDICANSLGPPIDWSFVGDMCEDSRPLWLWRLRMMGFAGSLEVPVAWMFQCRSDVMCLSRPILQLVAKIIKKEREKCRFLKISQIENMSSVVI